MLEDPRLLAPPVITVREVPAPTPDVPAVDGTELPPPTSEQTQTADSVFTGPVQRDPVTTLFGVLTSALLLRDIAVDTFDTSGEDEEPKPKLDEDEDADSRD